MHHCLLIPEVALSIVRFLADSELTQTDYPCIRNSNDLAMLAQTCRALSELALNVLWEAQYSLTPIVMCLPSDLWKFTHQGEAISFKRDPTPLDWMSVKKYARRIRFICRLRLSSLPRLDDQALTTLLTPSNFSALFPSLQSLDYSVISFAAPMIHSLTHVLSTGQHLESMTNLTIQALQNKQLHCLLEAIRIKATRLGTLTIESSSSTSNLPLPVELLEGRFRFLRKLQLGVQIDVSAECLTCLAGMEYLQEMGLYLRPNSIETEGSVRVAHKQTFPALKSIKVTATLLDQCIPLVSLITSPFLDTITVTYCVRALVTVIEAFFRQVQETCGGSSVAPVSTASSPLRTISLTLRNIQGSVSPLIIYPSQTLAPLLALRNLRTLRLYLGIIAIDDGFLQEAANAWSAHLRVFEEGKVSWIPRASTDLPGVFLPTLGGIGMFVRRCSRLERLGVAFDGRHVPELEEFSDEHQRAQGKQKREQRDEGCNAESSQGSRQQWNGPLSSSALEVLDVYDSPIDDPQGIGMFLKYIAPALRMIMVEPPSDDVCRKWEEVGDQTKLIVRVRTML